MFVVLLQFAQNKAQAGQFMQGHRVVKAQILQITPSKADARLSFLLA